MIQWQKFKLIDCINILEIILTLVLLLAIEHRLQLLSSKYLRKMVLTLLKWNIEVESYYV